MLLSMAARASREHALAVWVSRTGIFYVQSDVAACVQCRRELIISAISNLAPSIWPVAITTKWLGPLDMANGCRSPRAQFAA